MKRILLLTALLVTVGTSLTSQAQVAVQFGRPVVREQWYASDNNYYYLPEKGVYYNVPRKVYVFPQGGSWYYANRLPASYGNYTYRSSKFVRINDRTPFNRHSEYKQKYGNSPKRQGRHDNGNHNGVNNNNNPGRVNHGNVDNGHHRNKNAGQGNTNRGNSRGNTGKNKGNGKR